LAGGARCGAGAICKGFDRADEAACLTQSMSEGGEMACCEQEESPAGALAGMICCDVICGESADSAEFGFAAQNLIPAPRLIVVRTILLDAIGEAETATVSIKSANYNLLHHDPPDLYLFNSTFLI
ncbi:MAG TPA: hypothetical protein VI479_22040, partial [Blastocatellia bacterium]